MLVVVETQWAHSYPVVKRWLLEPWVNQHIFELFHFPCERGFFVEDLFRCITDLFRYSCRWFDLAAYNYGNYDFITYIFIVLIIYNIPDI